MKKRNLLAAGIAGGIAAAAIVRARRATFDFSDKTVLITGGSRGLGFLLAQEFAFRGARVAIAARDPDELQRARAELEGITADVITIVADVTEQDEVENAVRQVHEWFGPVDVLVNNAGVMTVGPMETMTLDDYRESLEAHFWAPLFTSLAVLPDMKSRHQGRIVNISSIGGKISMPHLLPYSAGKFALTGFSEGLRAELRKDNIYVTTVCPGLMRTGSPRNAMFKGNNRAEYAWFSISAGMPGISMSARRAARQIVNACQRGLAEVVLSLPAKLAAKFHGIFPGATANLLAQVNQLLPKARANSEPRTGSESFSRVSPSPLTFLNERAARKNNEVA